MGASRQTPYRIRPARMEDHGAIAAFTERTFEWGDYVAPLFKDWIAAANGFVLVATDEDDTAVAMVKMQMMSPSECWAHGARVHPGHRRRGLASRLTGELVEWARDQGAQVMRLLVEEGNPAARDHVLALGLRPVANFVAAHREIDGGTPVPSGNGGRRKPAPERLRAVPSAEAGLAFQGWQAGPLARAARGLFSTGWLLRRLTLDDMQHHARAKELWDSSIGSVIAIREFDAFWVSWIDTRPDDAMGLARALLDLAGESGEDLFYAMIPDLPWLREAFATIGCGFRPITVFAMAI